MEQDNIEQELKWRADSTLQQSVANWVKPLCQEEELFQMDARYYDTKDGLLAQHEAGLRIRSENDSAVCCLKLRSEQKGALFVREEYECPADDIEQGLAVLPTYGAPQELCETLQAEGVFMICQVQFTRHVLTLTQNGMVAELALDNGTLTRGQTQAPLCEIELEHQSGDPRAFLNLGAQLAQVFGLEPEPLSKLARAMALEEK